MDINAIKQHLDNALAFKSNAINNVSSSWAAYLTSEEWRKPFSGHPTRKGLWEQVQAPDQIDAKGPCMSSTNEWLAMPVGNGCKLCIMKWRDYDQPKPEMHLLTVPRSIIIVCT